VLFPRPEVSQYTIPATEAVVAKLKEGPQTAKLKKDLWVYLTAPRDFVDEKVKPIGTWRVELERKWELVGGETVKNEEVRWAVEKAMTVDVTEIWDGEVVIKEVVVERPTTRAAPATR